MIALWDKCTWAGAHSISPLDAAIFVTKWLLQRYTFSIHTVAIAVTEWTSYCNGMVSKHGKIITIYKTKKVGWLAAVVAWWVRRLDGNSMDPGSNPGRVFIALPNFNIFDRHKNATYHWKNKRRHNF